MEPLFTKQQESQLINQFASAAHEAWRKGFDPVYAETGVPSKQRVKKNSDGTEADINVSFDQLHPDWKKENLEAGKAALVATSYELHTNARKNPNNSNVSYIDIAAEHIHNEWMKRNPKAEWNAAQHVPYADLPESEKEKDRVQAREMTGLVETMKKSLPEFSEATPKINIDLSQKVDDLVKKWQSNDTLANLGTAPKKP